MKYLFIIEKSPGNFSGYFPDIPGCGTTGRSVEKILSNASEALELHLENETRLPRTKSLSWHLNKGGLKLVQTDLATWISYEQTVTILN